MQASTTGRFALLALLAGATGIAGAPIFVRLSETGPGATAFYRVALALPLLGLWMRHEAGRQPQLTRPTTRRDHGLLGLAGCFFAIDLAFWHWSIKFTSVANSTLLANCAPVFVTLGARVIFGEQITPRFLAGLALAFAGAALLVGASLELSPRHLAGDGLAVLAAVFYAAYQLTLKQLRARFTTATIMTWSGLACAPVLLGIAWFSGETLLPATATGWMVVTGLALVSQVGGQTLIAYAFAHLTASFGSVGLLFQPVMAAMFAWLLLHEALRPWQLAGGAIVLSGIALASRRVAR